MYVFREMATRSTTRLTASSSKSETKVVKLPTVAVGDSSVTSTAQTNSKPRREVLVRQPSYCKILDDIKGTEAKVANLKEETIEVTDIRSSLGYTSSLQFFKITFYVIILSIIFFLNRSQPRSTQTRAIPWPSNKYKQLPSMVNNTRL